MRFLKLFCIIHICFRILSTFPFPFLDPASGFHVLLLLHLHRFMRKWKMLPSIPGCSLYSPPPPPPPHEGHQKFQWEGSPRGSNFQAGGVRFSRSFFSNWDFETRIIIVFFFSQLTPVPLVFLYLI